jgi:hypothetical protein
VETYKPNVTPLLIGDYSEIAEFLYHNLPVFQIQISPQITQEIKIYILL